MDQLGFEKRLSLTDATKLALHYDQDGEPVPESPKKVPVSHADGTMSNVEVKQEEDESNKPLANTADADPVKEVSDDSETEDEAQHEKYAAGSLVPEKIMEKYAKLPDVDLQQKLTAAEEVVFHAHVLSAKGHVLFSKFLAGFTPETTWEFGRQEDDEKDDSVQDCIDWYVFLRDELNEFGSIGKAVQAFLAKQTPEAKTIPEVPEETATIAEETLAEQKQLPLPSPEKAAGSPEGKDAGTKKTEAEEPEKHMVNPPEAADSLEGKDGLAADAGAADPEVGEPEKQTVNPPEAADSLQGKDGLAADAGAADPEVGEEQKNQHPGVTGETMPKVVSPPPSPIEKRVPRERRQKVLHRTLIPRGWNKKVCQNPELKAQVFGDWKAVNKRIPEEVRKTPAATVPSELGWQAVNAQAAAEVLGGQALPAERFEKKVPAAVPGIFMGGKDDTIAAAKPNKRARHKQPDAASNTVPLSEAFKKGQ